MYRCVSIQSPDQNIQCILWRENSFEDLQIFTLDNVTYGTGSAAFLSIPRDEQQHFPLGSKIVLSDFYVDDMLTGADTLAELLQMKDQINSLLSAGGFHLRIWCSNSKELLPSIPAEDKEEFLQIDENDATKALGLIWQPKTD